MVAFVRSSHNVQERIKAPRGGIRCPKCGWEPGKDDRWSCDPGGCGHVWNTFETSGTCPQCNRHWSETACLRCSEWSPHEDWYDTGDDD